MGAALAWPVANVRINRGFRPASDPRHVGVDLGGPLGTPILAAHGGRVVYAGHDFHGYGNMVLLVRDARGWANLCRLLTRAHAQTRVYAADAGARRGARVTRTSRIAEKPRVTLADVEAHAEGLVCLSGCASRGIRDEPTMRRLLRAFGLREIASGVTILAQDTPRAGVWSRVAGDALDLAALVSAYREDNPRRNNVAVAIGAIAGIAWVDFWCARRLHSGRPHGSYRVHQQYVAEGPSRRTASGEFPAAHR